jgi:L-threonylcarbamoyladenylate synthase
MLLRLNDKNIKRAAIKIKEGALVAFPTETVYGLGCDAFNGEALAKVFEVKKRPLFDPLIIHIASLDMLGALVCLSKMQPQSKYYLDVLSKNLWPGPLTLVLPKLPSVPGLATAGLETCAIRFPAHEGALRFIAGSTGAIAAPSANPFGYLSPTCAEHVAEQLGKKVDIILDGGHCAVGVESTVLDLSGDKPRILRPGGTTKEAIEQFTGVFIDSNTADTQERIQSPGRLKSHYAPKTKLCLHTIAEMVNLRYDENDAFLFFDASSFMQFEEKSTKKYTKKKNIFILSGEGVLTEAASNLFRILHEIDRKHVNCIHAQQVINEGLGVAINDRLCRAQNK